MEKTSNWEFVQIDLSQFVHDEEYSLKKTQEIYSASLGLPCKGIISNAAEQVVKPLRDFNSREILDLISINSLATWALTAKFWDNLSSNNGKVISISSVHNILSKPGFGAYAISKAAMSAVTRAISLEAEGRFAAVSISPGAIETTMLLEGFEGFPQKYRDLIDILPTRRLGQPEDVAELVTFILETESNYLNGSDIRIDGGISGRLHDPL